MRALRNEIFFAVISAMTAEFLVMNLQLLHASAVLTSPIVAL